MIEVIEKARMLGEAIRDSAEYKEMQLREAEAETDPAANALKQQIREMNIEYQKTLERLETADMSVLEAMQGEMDASKKVLAELPSIRARDAARMQFSRLMEQVNNVMQYILYGEISSTSGCGGNCSGCAGCQ